LTGASKTISSSQEAAHITKTTIVSLWVRKTVGYGRFEGENALKALSDVYRFLNPLLNYWDPTMRLIAKEKLPSGR
jgi:hypothetical protein